MHDDIHYVFIDRICWIKNTFVWHKKKEIEILRVNVAKNVCVEIMEFTPHTKMIYIERMFMKYEIWRYWMRQKIPPSAPMRKKQEYTQPAQTYDGIR